MRTSQESEVLGAMIEKRTIFVLSTKELIEAHEKFYTKNFFNRKGVLKNCSESCATYFNSRTMQGFATLHDDGESFDLEKLKKEFGFIFVVNENLQPTKVEAIINPEKNNWHEGAVWWEEILDIHSELSKELALWKTLRKKANSKLVAN